MKLNLVTKRDEDYWDKYRATPKSFVSLETAQKLWGSRFGSLTSVRVAPKSGQTPEQAAAALQTEILKTLTPDKTRMEFQPVKYVGVSAAVGSNDFSQLFLGFSFFLILAAALLVGLVFRLGIERRGTSIGLLCRARLHAAAGCGGTFWKRGWCWSSWAASWGPRPPSDMPS